MKYGKAFFAGVTGGVVMSLLMAIGRAMGMQMNLEMMEGTMLGLQPSTTTWLAGLMMHLIISGLIALIYAAGFEYVTHSADWPTGMMFSLIHIVIAGFLMGMVPVMHPLIPAKMPAPSLFMSNHGMIGIVAFIMLHLIYGGIVGAIYTPVHRHFKTLVVV